MSSKKFYELVFKDQLRECTGEAFQRLFEKLMTAAYGDDFRPNASFGNEGDRKCDGYRVSERRIFQVYAPQNMKSAKVCRKIETDFRGAAEYWCSDMDEWTFVHNRPDGLPPAGNKRLNELIQRHPDVRISCWNPSNMLDVFASITDLHKLARWLGVWMPEADEIASVSFAALQEVIEFLERKPPDPDADMRLPAVEKLQANELDDRYREMLVSGRLGQKRVEEFFATYPDPKLDNEIAEAIHAYYTRLRDRGMHTANGIFEQLFGLIRGGNVEARSLAAVFAILSYYFDKCIIFENPPLVAQTSLSSVGE